MGPNANLKEKQCEGTTTTQQLLADLTNDFEEAITAEICLSNQLLDANLNCKIENTKDILILKSQSIDIVKINQSPMESNKLLETSDQQKTKDAEIVETENESLKSTCELKVEAESPAKRTDDLSAIVITPTKQDVIRPTIISVEELPPIRTDSTMTASEVEDNIEERLSQLDGTPVQPLNSSDVSSIEHSVIGAIPATPPRTPPPAIRQQHSNQVQLQSQQHTPTTPLSQHLQQLAQQQNTFTPQSSTSSVNTMGSTNIPKDFMKDSAGELEDQDIEEVLKALKGLDSTTAAETICDLNVLFNEVYTTLNYEEINSQNASTKPNPLKEAQAEIEKKQLSMQRKIDFLLRRLRKVQSRHMCKQASEEISGLFDWSARIVSRSAKLSHEDDVNERQQLNYAEEKSHPVTSTQLSTMLRKIELVANAQQLSTSSSSNPNLNFNKRKTKKVVNSSLDQNAEHKIATVVPTFDEKITEEIGHVTGLLQSELHEVQNSIDSDATESSSGGESADEMVTYNNQIQQSLHIAKRAAWRYSRDRAAIASRWSWLLSQISDLEIKIRQHSELHQEIIRTKGSVVNKLESNISSSSATTATAPFNGYKGAQPSADIKESNEEQELSGCCRTRGILASNFRKRKLFQTTNIHTFSKKAARPSTIKCGCQWPLHPCALCTGRSDPTAPRDLPDTMMLADRVALLDPGYHPVLSFPDDISNSIHFEGICRLPEWQQRIMRCPVKNIAKGVWKAEREAAGSTNAGKKNSEYVKRKYIKKKDLNKEQQQPNSRNGTGTLSMSSTPLVANKSTKNAKIARLYPSTNDAEMSMKTTSTMNNNSNHNYQQMSDHRHQNSAQCNPNPAHSLSISNIVKSNKSRKLSSSTANSTFHYNHNLNDNNNYSNNELNYLHSDSWDSLVTRSRTTSPIHGSSSNYHKYERSLDRRNRTSYDIDNIVIPYSVAAATRVELLPYKEIPTPKWRLIEEESEVSIGSSEGIKHKFQKEVPSTIVNNNNNNNNSKTESIDCLEFKKVDAVKTDIKKQINNITAGVNTIETSTTYVNEVLTNSAENIKTKLATKRTYSEKENSVDPIDAFDSIKDSNHNSAKDLNGGESVSKKCKTTISNNNAEDTAESDLVNDSKGKFYAAEADKILKSSDSSDVAEDTSDEAMTARHEKALVEERRTFQTYLKFPWSTRSRANRRIDSRAESSGANTPDPASPAPNTPSVGGGDLESIPSPVPPLTPLNQLDSISEVGETTSGLGSVIVNNSIAPPPFNMQNCINKRSERRRTTSAKKERDQERRSLTPDSKELILPYEPLKFPIASEVFDNMIKMMPVDHREDTIDDTIHNISTKVSSIVNSIKNTIPNRYNIGDKNISKSSICSRRERNEYDSLVGFIDDDGYSKHHLAPDDDYLFDSYECKKNIDDSDIESSEADPFSDDDPNDPEWKGESEERERIRRKL